MLNKEINLLKKKATRGDTWRRSQLCNNSEWG